MAYIVGTFAVQATSHFAVNREHYASVTFMRPEPIFALGFLSMVLQGGILSHLFDKFTRPAADWKHGFALRAAGRNFFVSYLALAEPAKYQVPSVGRWMLVESGVGLIQFGLFGVLVGWIHSKLNPTP